MHFRHTLFVYALISWMHTMNLAFNQTLASNFDKRTRCEYSFPLNIEPRMIRTWGAHMWMSSYPKSVDFIRNLLMIIFEEIYHNCNELLLSLTFSNLRCCSCGELYFIICFYYIFCDVIFLIGCNEMSQNGRKSSSRIQRKIWILFYVDQFKISQLYESKW